MPVAFGKRKMCQQPETEDRLTRIRRLLTSVRRANEVHHAVLPKQRRPLQRHWIDPFHTDPRPRTRSYYRGLLLLLLRGGFVGGFTGALLGLNLGVAIPLILEQFWMLALTPLLLALCGWMLGVFLARCHVTRLRDDLFSWES